MSKAALKNRLLNLWYYLVGDENTLSHEQRIFHSFSIIALIICIVMIFLNLAINSVGSLIIVIAIICIHPVAFYLSRFRNNLKLAIILSGLESNIFLGLNYFLNAGIQGPSLMLFIATLLLMNSLLHNQDLKLWIALNLITVCAIIGIEYFYPHAIIYNYPTKTDLYLDTLVTYILVVLLISYCIYYIGKNHKLQRAELEEKANSLKKLNEEKDKIFSIVSHDLRSPLTSLQQYLDFISDDGLEEKERKKLEKKLLKNTIQTQELLTNILHWSKSQLNGITVKPKKFNLLQLLSNTVDLFKNQCNQKHISFNILIDDDFSVVADKDLLQLIVRNLLNNAVKFTNKGGQIILKAEIVNKECIITVKDNGIGIPESRKESIFTLKAESTFGTNHENGTGLGLMICKEYIDLQGGRIWFESDEAGTEFHIAIPNK